VFTLVGSLSSAMMPISLAVAGPVADAIGLQTWYIAGGAVMALMAAGALFVPVIVGLEENHVGRPAEAVVPKS
jgi:DHA3 family macrolide efflux protein-like MFS transporter